MSPVFLLSSFLLKKKSVLITANISEALNYKQYFLDIALRLSLGSYLRFKVTSYLHGSTVVAMVVLHEHQEREEGLHDEDVAPVSVSP